MTVASRLRTVVGRRDVQLLAGLTAAELLLLGAYLLSTPAQLTRARYALYPFVWINVGLWAVMQSRVPPASRRRRLLGATVAGVYLLALLYLAGLIGVHPEGTPRSLVGITVGYGTPGWERIRVVMPAFHLTLIPFRVVGYLALSVLVYVTVLDAATAAVSGALGFVSCLSCSFPIIASLASGAVGGSAAVVGVLFGYAVDISTAVFLLYYRPGFGPVAGRRPGSRDDRETPQRIE